MGAMESTTPISSDFQHKARRIASARRPIEALRLVDPPNWLRRSISRCQTRASSGRYVKFKGVASRTKQVMLTPWIHQHYRISHARHRDNDRRHISDG